MIDYIISKRIFGISLFVYNVGIILILPYIFLLTVLFLRQIRKSKFAIKITYVITMIALNLGSFLLTYYLYFNNVINFIDFIKRLNRNEWVYNDLVFFSIYTCIAFVLNIISMVIVIIFCKKKGRKTSVVSYIFQLILLLLLLSEFSISTSFYCQGIKKVRINEICSSNYQQYITYYNDVLYDDCDYIEIKNDGILPVELDAYYLSDKQKNLLKYHVPDSTLLPGEYLMVPLDSKFEEGMFSIAADGERVNLSYNGLWGIIEIDRIDCPKTRVNVSWSRVNDTDIWDYMECSPLHINDGSIVIMEEPVFSAESGFYDEAFYLDIQVPEGYSLAYTVDGSKPTLESAKYSEPIYVYNRSDEENVYRSIKNVVFDYNNYEPDLTKVDKAFVVRGFLYNDDNVGEEFVKTYFVGLDMERYQDVISIVVDPSLMWGDNGIYVTGSEYDTWYQEGQQGDRPLANFEKDSEATDNVLEYEIPANLCFYESKEIKMNQKVGLRIQGASTREYELKRFKIYARKKYNGKSTFEYPFYGDKLTHSVVLRFEYGGGYVNALFNRLAQNRYADAPLSRKVQVFVNGEYWYDTYMYERYDERYYSEKYGLDKDRIGILDSYQNFVDWYSDWDSVNSIFDIDMFDIQSFIDFYIFNMYYCNVDINEGHNVACWLYQDEEENVRFRWSLYDIDCLSWLDPKRVGYESVEQINTFGDLRPFTYFRYDTAGFYSKVVNICGFKEQFAVSLMDIINTNLSYENVCSEMEDMGIKDDKFYSFFRNRPEYMKKYISEEYGFANKTNRIRLEINDAEHGNIKVNTCYPSFNDDNSWEGEYFIDFPITLEANPLEGYRFAGWSGDIESDDLCITIDMSQGDVNVKANFIKCE